MMIFQSNCALTVWWFFFPNLVCFLLNSIYSHTVFFTSARQCWVGFIVYTWICTRTDDEMSLCWTLQPIRGWGCRWVGGGGGWWWKSWTHSVGCRAQWRPVEEVAAALAAAASCLAGGGSCGSCCSPVDHFAAAAAAAAASEAHTTVIAAASPVTALAKAFSLSLMARTIGCACKNKNKTLHYIVPPA